MSIAARPLRSRVLRWLTGAMMGAALIGLQGCAALNQVRTEVQSFGDWPATRTGGPFVFERLPSQANQAEQAAQLEAAALPALQEHGFTLAQNPADALYTVQLAAIARVTQRGDPFWPGPYWYHPYPWGRPGVGGWWGTGGGGLALSYRFEQPQVDMQVSVVVRDRKTHAVLHEARAGVTRLGTSDPAWFAPLFDAALKDFPLAAGPRTVIVPLRPE
ncbi:hypothetical protein [uncultured Aquabacterium sp.]|uniref:hypothetical protein n=1 Tax=Aquabacterium sp. TaxID=1872578 RepID=UPI0025F6996B|nr:hypothetical protein [uncultured Aquabacterium sp.]